MKELYYDQHTIAEQAQQFLEKVTYLRVKHQISINPAKVALLIVDMQDFFLSNLSHAYIPSARSIVSRIVELQNCCLQQGILVIQTRHVDSDYDEGMMQKWWKDIRITDSMSKIISEIANQRVRVINKSQYDAFYHSELDEILQIHHIEQLIITGVMTHLCCETTARSAFVRGYEVFFSIDGTATSNREFHLGSLMNLAHGFAIPMLVSEIVERLKG